MGQFNQYQIALKESYANGYHALVNDMDQANEVSDGLFHFLMNELSESEGCNSLETALQRLQRAIEDIQLVVSELEKNC